MVKCFDPVFTERLVARKWLIHNAIVVAGLTLGIGCSAEEPQSPNSAESEIVPEAATGFDTTGTRQEEAAQQVNAGMAPVAPAPSNSEQAIPDLPDVEASESAVPSRGPLGNKGGFQGR
ncbi:MAG: hypothetical protein ACI8P0_000398 [Planctomycetaceae bacterium]|jgi:hypothetical protein